VILGILFTEVNKQIFSISNFILILETFLPLFLAVKKSRDFYGDRDGAFEKQEAL
jgi:hypothetical protein